MTLDEIIAAFGRDGEVPRDALAAASEHADELAVRIDGAIDKLVNGVHLLPRQTKVLMFGLPVIACAKGAGVSTTMTKLLRLPEETLEDIYPAYVSVMLARLLLTSWDGDADGLFHLLEHADISDEARIALFKAMAYLTFEGRVDRARYSSLLERFERDNVLGDEDMAWFGWKDAVVLLGVRELEPALARVMARELFEDWQEVDRQDDRDRLAAAAADPRDRRPFEEDKCVPIEDPADAMQWIDNRQRAFAEMEKEEAAVAAAAGRDIQTEAAGETESGPSWEQINWLAGFLASRQVSETAMSLEMIDGYLTAIAIGPTRIALERYLSAIWGSEGAAGPTWDSEEQAHYFADVVHAISDEIARLVETGQPIEPMLAPLAPEDLAVEWAQGFEEGMYLNEAGWAPLWESERGKDILWSVLALADSEGDGDAYDAEPLSVAERETLVRRLPDTVKLIARFWKEGEQALRREPVRVEKVGRNDPCPCGSGKKYKKCCGSASPATIH